MSKIKRGWVIIIALVLFLIVTNPTPYRFKEFSGGKGTVVRKYNFIICSIYEYYYPNVIPVYYLGIALNFFKVGNE